MIGESHKIYKFKWIGMFEVKVNSGLNNDVVNQQFSTRVWYKKSKMVHDDKTVLHQYMNLKL